MNNNFDMKIVELKYLNGVVGDPYAEDLCHSVNTLINYIQAIVINRVVIILK